MYTANQSFRCPPTTFTPSEDAAASDSPVVQQLLDLLPALKIYTRASPQFQTLRETYNLCQKKQPLVICRPTTLAQVSSIVSLCASTHYPLAVRVGGHDVWGRSCIADAVIIDMREMDEMTLAEDKQTIKVGGGVLSKNLVAFTDTHGLCTANGTAGTVGWTGWAIWGGYGPFNDWVGLGVDQILEAKMITADGKLVEADSELLWGIRGAGGNLGVIVELTVRVYPMPKILGGFIAYKFDEAEKILKNYQALLETGVPDAFGGQIGLMKNHNGPSISMIFTWPAPDLEEGKRWLAIARGLGTVVVDTVRETTFKKFQEITSHRVSAPIFVYTRSVSIPKFSEPAIAILHKYAKSIPAGRQYNVIAHVCHGKALKSNPASSFALREPHILLHINASTEERLMDHAADWTEGLVKELKAAGQVMRGGYVNFMGPNEPTEECLGSSWERLKALKKAVDGANVFAYAQPLLK